MRVLRLVVALAVASCQQTAAPEQPRGHIRIDPIRPFPEAAQVRLFVETGYDERTHELVYSGKSGLLLTPLQRQAYETLLSVRTPVNLPDNDPFFMRAMCFIPHHFFRYYGGSGKQLGEIGVCFCCSGIEVMSGPQLRLKEGQELGVDYGRLKSLVRSWGQPTDVQCNE